MSLLPNQLASGSTTVIPMLTEAGPTQPYFAPASGGGGGGGGANLVCSTLTVANSASISSIFVSSVNGQPVGGGGGGGGGASISSSGAYVLCSTNGVLVMGNLPGAGTPDIQIGDANNTFLSLGFDKLSNENPKVSVGSGKPMMTYKK